MTEHNGGTKAHESLTLATLRSLHEAPAEWQLFGNPVSGLENPVLACKDTHAPGISSNSTIHPLLEATALGVWRCCNQNDSTVAFPQCAQTWLIPSWRFASPFVR
ncbi:hypothetical protein CGCSCA1_v008422 [Colletotrichum siamense]|nr:hypothetical protein CGCSCA1_v008422 [Colletotrichum siamense]